MKESGAVALDLIAAGGGFNNVRQVLFQRVGAVAPAGVQAPETVTRRGVPAENRPTLIARTGGANGEEGGVGPGSRKPGVPRTPESKTDGKDGGGPPGPPHEGREAGKERDPGEKRTLARAMANRTLWERHFDDIAVYGAIDESEDPVEDPTREQRVLTRGIETAIALFALETLESHDEPVNLRAISDAALDAEDMQLVIGFSERDKTEQSLEIQVKRLDIFAILEGIDQRRSEARDLIQYRNLELSAQRVVAEHQSSGDNVTLLDVFTNFDREDLYREAYRGMYSGLDDFISKQKERVGTHDFGRDIALQLRATVRSRTGIILGPSLEKKIIDDRYPI